MFISLARIAFIFVLAAVGHAAEEFVVSTLRQPALPSDNQDNTGATRAHGTASIPKEFASYQVPGPGAVDVSNERGNSFEDSPEVDESPEKPEDGFYMKNELSKVTRSTEDRAEGAPMARQSTEKDPFFMIAGAKDNSMQAQQSDRQETNAKPKGDEKFFFQPTAERSAEVPATREKNFYLRAEPEKTEQDGYFTKAVKSVVGSISGFNTENTAEAKQSTASAKSFTTPSRHEVNIQLIDVLEKQVKLLHETGQKEQAQQVTKDLLEAYSEMASALKAKKMST